MHPYGRLRDLPSFPTRRSSDLVNAVCPAYVDTDMTRESVARIAAKTGMSPDAALQAALATTGQAHLIPPADVARAVLTDRKSTRLNSSHVEISYAVFCLKKKKP